MQQLYYKSSYVFFFPLLFYSINWENSNISQKGFQA